MNASRTRARTLRAVGSYLCEVRPVPAHQRDAVDLAGEVLPLGPGRPVDAVNADMALEVVRTKPAAALDPEAPKLARGVGANEMVKVASGSDLRLVMSHRLCRRGDDSREQEPKDIAHRATVHPPLVAVGSGGER